MNTQLSVTNDGSVIAELRARPIDKELQAKITRCEAGIESDFWISTDGYLMFRERICVPNDENLIQKILQEASSGCLSIHPKV
ncbi:integrase [Gossypium australe]|uniref:Integrase n=1 Tax=Gossypium australe TaxID=47621 RepID=A0A5B6V9E7_9ROSI|nr:integrase [Gossypium australe]